MGNHVFPFYWLPSIIFLPFVNWSSLFLHLFKYRYSMVHILSDIHQPYSLLTLLTSLLSPHICYGFCFPVNRYLLLLPFCLYLLPSVLQKPLHRCPTIYIILLLFIASEPLFFYIGHYNSLDLKNNVLHYEGGIVLWDWDYSKSPCVYPNNLLFCLQQSKAIWLKLYIFKIISLYLFHVRFF